MVQSFIDLVDTYGGEYESIGNCFATTGPYEEPWDIILFKFPEITKILPQKVIIGQRSTLTILGRNFNDENMNVRIDGNEFTPNSITDNKIIVGIPPDILPGSHIVEVECRPDPEKDYKISSNQYIFILVKGFVPGKFFNQRPSVNEVQ